MTQSGESGASHPSPSSRLPDGSRGSIVAAPPSFALGPGPPSAALSPPPGASPDAAGRHGGALPNPTSFEPTSPTMRMAGAYFA